MISAYYLTPAGLAAVREQARKNGERLRELRAERETAAVLARAALPDLPAFELPVLDARARDFLESACAKTDAARFLP